MKTLIFKIDKDNIDMGIIDKAADVIKSGGLVAFPTETVYGLGGDGLNPQASEKIYTAKGRPSDNPLILHISDISQLVPLVKEIPENAVKLYEKFWPGPLTLIFKKSEAVPYETSGGLDTVAVRFPSNAIAQSFISASGTPIAAPSANTSGRPSPTRASHVAYDLDGKIDMILDGGACDFGLESTIVDVSEDIPCLLRPGAITLEMLRDTLGNVNVDKAVTDMLEGGELPKAPGMKYTHYSPNADVIIVRGERQKIVQKINELIADTDIRLKVGVIATEENKYSYRGCEVLVAGSINEPEEIASNIFKMLRKCDHHGIDRVYAEGLPESEIGLAIMNRLKKAAGYHIVDA